MVQLEYGTGSGRSDALPKGRWVGVKHRGVAPAKEERMEFRKEGAGGGEI